MTEILETKKLAEGRSGSRVFMTLYERVFKCRDKVHSYFFVGRGEDVPEPCNKRSDGVVIVAITNEETPRIVLTSEFRVPIGCREIGFPAGLVDSEDYNQDDAVASAASRELKEETGLDFELNEKSPENLYSSAGLTNESITMVFGTASGTPTTDGNEGTEDIEVMLLTFDEMLDIMDNPPEGTSFGKTAWPILWAYKKFGEFTT